MKQRQKGGVVKYRSVRYIFYVVMKFINLRFIIRIKLVGRNGDGIESNYYIGFLTTKEMRSGTQKLRDTDLPGPGAHAGQTSQPQILCTKSAPTADPLRSFDIIKYFIEAHRINYLPPVIVWSKPTLTSVVAKASFPTPAELEHITSTFFYEWKHRNLPSRPSFLPRKKQPMESESDHG